MLVQAFNEKRSLRRDGVETLGFINQLSATNAPDLIKAHPDLNGVYAPDLIGAAYFTQERSAKAAWCAPSSSPPRMWT